MLQNFNTLDAVSRSDVGAKLAWDLKYQVWLLANIIGNDTSMLESTKIQIQEVAENLDDICVQSLS